MGEAGPSHAGGESSSMERGRLERQDSANYQLRPPALSQRQDSAHNLQVWWVYIHY